MILHTISQAKPFKNKGATACCAWPRAEETFNGLQKVLKIVYIPDSKT